MKDILKQVELYEMPIWMGIFPPAVNPLCFSIFFHLVSMVSPSPQDYVGRLGGFDLVPGGLSASQPKQLRIHTHHFSRTDALDKETHLIN